MKATKVALILQLERVGVYNVAGWTRQLQVFSNPNPNYINAPQWVLPVECPTVVLW